MAIFPFYDQHLCDTQRQWSAVRARAVQDWERQNNSKQIKETKKIYIYIKMHMHLKDESYFYASEYVVL